MVGGASENGDCLRGEGIVPSGGGVQGLGLRAMRQDGIDATVVGGGDSVKGWQQGLANALVWFESPQAVGA